MAQRMYLDRLRHELNLDEEQVAKVRALLAEEGKKTREAIRGVLNEEQKAGFERIEAEKPGRMISRVVAGDGSGGWGGLPPFSEKGDAGPLGIGGKELKKELGLTDEEAGKVEEIFKKYRKEKKEAFEKAADGMDLEGMGKAIAASEELDEKTLKAVREAVPPEKRQAFDALVEKKREEGPVVHILGGDGGEMGELGKEIEKALGEGLKGLGGRLKSKAASLLDGLPSLEEVCRRAGFQGEEGEILREKVKAVLEAERAYREFLVKGREKLDRSLADCQDEDAYKARMAEFRKERDALKAKASELKENLRGLLSFDQEAKLVALGVLD